MKTITVKLPEAVLEELRNEAQETGRSVSAVIRSRLEAREDRGCGSVHSLVSDLAGSVTGSRKAATNERRRFARR